MDEAPAETLTLPRSPTPRVAVLSRLVPHKQIEDVLDAVAELLPRTPDLHLDVVGGGWWGERLVAHAARLGITDARHLPWPRRRPRETSSAATMLGARAAVAQGGLGACGDEAAQHAVPTIGYRSSGGLTDSIVDGVTGLLVDDHAELVSRLDRLLSDHVLREQLGVKAQVRSGEFSWTQSADAMRVVLESVVDGRLVGGVV